GSGVLPLSKSTALNSATYIADLFRSPPHPALQWLMRARNSAMGNVDEGFERLTAAQRQIVVKSIQALARLIGTNLENVPMAEELKLQLQGWLRQVNEVGSNLSESLRIRSVELISQWMSQTDLGRVVSVL